MTREVRDIAKDIEQTWDHIPSAAQPWLEMMFRMKTASDPVEGHPGEAIILFFLAYSLGVSNGEAKTHRGELYEMVEEYVKETEDA